MARKPNEVNTFHYQLLKNMVKAKSGLNCDHIGEIQQLEILLRKEIADCLSRQTLNRVFGIISDGFNPSIQTLDILARYVNYKSYEEFCRLNAKGIDRTVQTSNISRFITKIFNDFTYDPSLEPGVMQVVKSVVYEIAKDNQLAEEVYCANATSEFGRLYFFEHFVFMDAIDKAYGDSLSYYISNAQSRKEKFFAYTMYCYRFFLINNKTMFKQYFDLLNDFKHSEILTFHPMVIDRFYAIQVLNQYIEKQDAADIGDVVEILSDYDILSTHHESIYFAGHLVAEALIVVGEYEKAWDILNNGKVKPSAFPSCLHAEFDQQVNILKLVSGYFTGNISRKKALYLHGEIIDKPLPILIADYYSFFLLAMEQDILGKEFDRAIADKINKLVQKTSFTFFNKPYIANSVFDENFIVAN